MFQFDFFRLYYDIIAYMIAVRSLVDEILYKLGFKKHLDFRKELPSDLTGRVAIVTGGTRGLGLTVVRVLISKGCFVFVASSQTPDKFDQITAKIYQNIPEVDEETSVKRGTVALHNLDLTSMSSVVEFIKAFNKRKLHLNYMICNAGIMFAPRQITQDNFESHLAVNYLGHCLLITELLPLLKKTADEMNVNCRIISVASSTHHITRLRFEDLLGEANYSSSQAYAQSKLAQIMFTAKLARVMKNLKWNNVQCYSLHPGVILSELYEHVLLIQYFPFLIPIIKLVTRNMVQGAETTLFAALSDKLPESCSGCYLEECEVKESSKISQNEEEQERLWEVTGGLLRPWLTNKTVFSHEQKKFK